MAYMGIYKSPDNVFIRSTSENNDAKLQSKGCIMIIEVHGKNISTINSNTITAKEYLSKKPLLDDIDEREKFYLMKENGTI